MNLKGKENPDLPSVCSNYWPPNVALSLYFNHLVLSAMQVCIPQEICQAHSQYPAHRRVSLEKIPPAVEIYDKQTNFQFNVIKHGTPVILMILIIFFYSFLVTLKIGYWICHRSKIYHNAILCAVTRLLSLPHVVVVRYFMQRKSFQQFQNERLPY